MKNGFTDQNADEHKSLLEPTVSPLPSSEIIPITPSNSFNTLLRNLQCLNLVSVSVNVSTNHEEEDKEYINDRQKEKNERDGRGAKSSNLQRHVTQDKTQGQGLGLGIPRSFSTLLRSFQIFNLVSVLVNVSTNHEDEQEPRKAEKTNRIVPDYYQDIFGVENDEDSEETMVTELKARECERRKEQGSKFPVMFRLAGADRHEILIISASSTYNDLMSRISNAMASSPNCAHKNDKDEGRRITAVDAKWDTGEEKEWPEKTRLTEENCEAVLLMMNKLGTGKMHMLEVRLGEIDGS